MDKSLLYEYCLSFIEARISNFQNAIEQAQAASTDDTKSSAGDKYETTREMMQQEIDRNQKQLYEASQQKQLLKAIENVGSAKEAKNGSLIRTDQMWFYISISVGEINIDGQKVFAISQASPIGKLLIGKKQGDEFSFNGKKYNILEIS